MAALRGWRGAAFVLCALLMSPLSGCGANPAPPTPSSTTQPSGASMTPKDSRAAMLDKLTELITQLGGDWKTEDDPSAYPCTTLDGDEGEAFTALRKGPGYSDPEAVSEQARTILEQQGFTVERRSYPKENGRIEMIGSVDTGAFISIAVNPDRSGIIAQSDCVLAG